MTNPLRILHLSDTHVLADHGLHGGRDTTALLEEAVSRIERPVDLVVHSGDVSDDGSEESYRVVQGIISRLDAPAVYAVGNHDEQGAFGRVLAPDDVRPDGQVYAAHRFGGWRVIVLDSHRAGLIGGEIDDEQYAWLTAVVEEPAPSGSVVVMHHPPADGLSIVQRDIGFARRDRLAEVLDGSDVRAILAGHVHYQSTDALLTPSGTSIPVLIAPAVTHIVDTAAEYGKYRQLAASGFVYEEVWEDGRVTSAAAQWGPHDVMVDDDPREVADLAERLAEFDRQARAGR